MTTPIEALKQITADQLNDVIDADLSAFETGTEDATHVVTWLAQNYPELFQFAQDCVSRYFEETPEDDDQPGDLEVDDELAHLIAMNTAITLGVLCRALEAQQLLGE